MLLVPERPDRADGDCEREESRDERVIAGERERELSGVAGGDG